MGFKRGRHPYGFFHTRGLSNEWPRSPESDPGHVFTPLAAPPGGHRALHHGASEVDTRNYWKPAVSQSVARRVAVPAQSRRRRDAQEPHAQSAGATLYRDAPASHQLLS